MVEGVPSSECQKERALVGDVRCDDIEDGMVCSVVLKRAGEPLGLRNICAALSEIGLRRSLRQHPSHRQAPSPPEVIGA